MTERAGRVFHEIFQDAAPPDLSGFLWQHPRLLVAFAVAVGSGALACLAFSKVQRTAVLAASLAVVALLVQWLVGTVVVFDSTMRMLQSAAKAASQ